VSLIKRLSGYLAKKGYKKLGAGVDQTAYLEPGTGYVLKVFGTQGGESFSPDHKMFFDWAKYCMKNSGNPFLPRFGGYDSFVLDGDRYLQIRQEPLQPAGRMGVILEIMANAVEDENIADLDELSDYVEDYFDQYSTGYQKLLKQLGPQQMQLMLDTINRHMPLVIKKAGV
jgi:hypothetical protein